VSIVCSQKKHFLIYVVFICQRHWSTSWNNDDTSYYR